EYPSQLIEMGFIPFPCKSKPHGHGFSQNNLRLKHEVIDKPSEDIFNPIGSR
ncbi:MAG: hypothetical protein ACJAXX_001655, partial [Roseivirga sp.]